MGKCNILSIILLFTISCIVAQNKQLTIKDAVIGQYTNLYPKYIHSFNWVPKSENYTFVDKEGLKTSSIKSKKDKLLFSVEDIHKIIGNDTLTERIFHSYKWLDENKLLINKEPLYFVIDTKSKKLINQFKFPENAKNVFFDNSHKKAAYTIDNNMYYYEIKANKYVQITNDHDGLVNGDIVARNEFGIDHGIFWSPKGNQIAFYHKDQRMVTDYPLVDITTRIATVKNIKYPMAGMTNEKEQVGVYNIATGKTIYLDTDTSKDQFLTVVTWGPEEKYIYIGILNRKQNHMWLNKYDALSGKFVKTLFEETNDNYVEPLFPLYFFPNNPNQFLWISRRDGWMHIYQYNTDGKLINQLTKGKWEVIEFIGFNDDGSKIYFMSTADSPLERRAYKVDVTTLAINKITKVAGTHHVKEGFGGKYFLDNYNSISVPGVYQIVDENGKVLKSLLKAEDPLTDYEMPKAKIFKIKTAEGVKENGEELYARMITPPDFNESKKYPVIVYVYGGPHVQLITNSWLGGAQMWLYYMAQKGYICFTVDNRGSANRGAEFETIVHRWLGQVEMRDQIAGIKYLKSMTYVDTNRIGVFGWSFGGFMTTSLMMNYPETFKVGVAGGPVIDWKYYEVMYGERYMDMPQENPDGYSKTSLINKAKNLKGKLMIIHGAIDNTVVWQNSLSFIRECVKNNIPVDYFVYPMAEHNVRSFDRIHLMDKISHYFDDYLKNYYTHNGK